MLQGIVRGMSSHNDITSYSFEGIIEPFVLMEIFHVGATRLILPAVSRGHPSLSVAWNSLAY